jgi:hypothetical protein
MRLLTLSLLLATAALMTRGDPVSAQSATSYPWCSRGTKGVPGNCYYASKEQCQRTISGNGVYCMRNPWYREARWPPQAVNALCHAVRHRRGQR